MERYLTTEVDLQPFLAILESEDCCLSSQSYSLQHQKAENVKAALLNLNY